VRTARFDRTSPEFRAHAGLESFELTWTQRKLAGSGIEQGYQTGIVASYGTDTVERLKDFIVVQLIRGCVFETFRKEGRISKFIGTGREHLNEETRKPDEPLPEFRHPDWSLDSTDRDPAYATIPGHPLGRHAGYQVERPDPFNSTSRVYLYRRQPREPRLFVSDHLKDVMKSNGWEKALNTNLEFITQLYYEKDIARVAGKDAIRARHLAEVDWSVRFQWSYRQSRFVPTASIDPFCESKDELQEMSLEEYEADLASRAAPAGTCVPD
jgi:hypothetical protein